MFYFFHSKQLTTLNTHMLVLFQLLNTPSLSAQILFYIILKVHSNIWLNVLLISRFCSTPNNGE